MFYSSERIDGNETRCARTIFCFKFYSSERIDGNETNLCMLNQLWQSFILAKELMVTKLDDSDI